MDESDTEGTENIESIPKSDREYRKAIESTEKRRLPSGGADDDSVEDAQETIERRVARSG